MQILAKRRDGAHAGKMGQADSGGCTRFFDAADWGGNSETRANPAHEPKAHHHRAHQVTASASLPMQAKVDPRLQWQAHMR